VSEITYQLPFSFATENSHYKIWEQLSFFLVYEIENGGLEFKFVGVL
jgi:hypothetical protein